MLWNSVHYVFLICVVIHFVQGFLAQEINTCVYLFCLTIRINLDIDFNHWNNIVQRLVLSLVKVL